LCHRGLGSHEVYAQTLVHAESSHGGDAEIRPNSILPGFLQPLERECEGCVRLRGQAMPSDYDFLFVKNEQDDQEVRIWTRTLVLVR